MQILLLQFQSRTKEIGRNLSVEFFEFYKINAQHLLKVKLQRAHGECLGVRSRRRT